MFEKLKRKTEVSFRRAGNNKGMTLVELVVAVAILGVLSSILLHAFVTSMNVTKKARRISEATDAAQNIQEVVEAVSYADFISGQGDAAAMLNVADADFTGDPESKTAVIRGIEAGQSTFDAKVSFRSHTEDGEYVVDGEPIVVDDGFYKINSKKIAQYATPDGTFYKQFDDPTENPDKIADTEFAEKFGTKEILSKTRKIRLDVTKDENDIINVTTTWTYTYEYNSGISSGNYYGDHIDRGTGNPVETITPINEKAVIAGGIEMPTNDEYVTVYFMYYPYYTDEYQYKTVEKQKKNAYGDQFEVWNLDDLPVRIILIKMKADFTNNGELLDNSAGSISKKLMLDQNYSCLISEYHSNDYVDRVNRGTADQIPETILTNAKVNIYNEETEAFATLKVRYEIKQVLPRLLELAGENIKQGTLVHNGANDRLYDVIIELYEPGEVDAGDPVSKFSASKILQQ